jgi:hypothetical protein
MSGIFLSRGNFTVPAQLIQEYQWVMDGFIDDENLGHLCTLVYPAKPVECPNCYLDPATGRSTGIYKDGGPTPFTNHTLCPHCNGLGRGEQQTTENIRLRVYYKDKYFTRGNPIEVPDGEVQIIGYLTDVPKINRSVELILDCDLQPLQRIRCIRSGNALPWGFGDRYFVMSARFIK